MPVTLEIYFKTATFFHPSSMGDSLPLSFSVGGDLLLVLVRIELLTSPPSPFLKVTYGFKERVSRIATSTNRLNGSVAIYLNHLREYKIS